MDALSIKRTRVAEATDDAERVAALNELSSALYEFDCTEAVEVADEAIALATALGDGTARGWALHHRGWALSSMGRLDEALDSQLSARAQFELEGELGGIANALMAIGDLYGDVGDTTTALEYLERARAPLKLANDELGAGLLMNLTGIALSHEGRHEEALDLFEQAEKIYFRIGDPLRVGTTRINQGYELLTLSATADEPHRMALIERVGRIAEETIERGDRLGEDGRHTRAYGKALMAQVMASKGLGEAATELAAKAEAEATSGGLDQLGIEIILDRAGWLLRAGRLDEASVLIEDAADRSKRLDMKRLLVRATGLRADLLEAWGDHAAALACHRDYHRLDGALHTDQAERRARLVATRFQVERARQEADLANVRVSELEALDKEKREFLASISHELRTPLAAVLGFATELSESWDMFEPDEARSLVRLIASQSADISAIVDDLLTVTRLEAGTMTVYPAIVNVSEHIADLAETTGRDSGKAIEWTGDATVWADPARLRQIIRNLISNAIRYGGNEVAVTVLAHSGMASIEVWDSGGPIPPARVATMFQPFDRAEGNGRNPNSVGLGLAVARSLARVMGGDLEYRYDHGSIFRLELPIPG
ncbi:MAG TPA: tetratricopeptide repeat-containing sensor histidine kinase [Acidimicrobiia bacterium]|nr:tetratricopeptide repeat-containing sensor histidine kinase [Acidimicrobiia bacterium]